MSSSIVVAGVASRDVITPRSIDELADAVRDLLGERRPFAFVGGGTQIDLGNPPRALDTIVRTVALDRVVDYVPEDQTITVEAGISLAELDRVLAQYGQMFPIDVMDRNRATVGGVIATNAYGRRRQRYGTLKDLILGVEIVRPDGVRARGGGKVVKNVAGFDLPKLMVGSLGTLGAIASATFRVYPLPAARRSAALRFAHADDVSHAVKAVIERRLEPESIALYNHDTLVVTFSGTVAGVDAQTKTLMGEIAAASSADARELTGLEHESYEQRERAVRRDGAWRFRIIAPPAAPVATLGAYVAGSPLAVPVAYPQLGVALHAYAEDAIPSGSRSRSGAAQFEDLRRYVGSQTGGHGRLVIDAMPDWARGHIDSWGAPPPSFALMRTMKSSFDPHGLCNAGRFVGGL
jgi:glycolate oxidase FAD binding subunit